MHACALQVAQYLSESKQGFWTFYTKQSIATRVVDQMFWDSQDFIYHVSANSKKTLRKFCDYIKSWLSLQEVKIMISKYEPCCHPEGLFIIPWWNFSYLTHANKGQGFYSEIIFSVLHNGAFCQNLSNFNLQECTEICKTHQF